MTEHITHITRDQLYHWTKRLESSPSAPIKDPDGFSLETLRSLNKIYTLQSLRVPRIWQRHIDLIWSIPVLRSQNYSVTL